MANCTPAEVKELERLTDMWLSAEASGNEYTMNFAHKQAEAIRNRHISADSQLFVRDDGQIGVGEYIISGQITYMGSQPIPHNSSIEQSYTVSIYYDNPGSGFTEQAFNSIHYDSNSSEVLMIPVTSVSDFVREWNTLDNIEIANLYLYLHGGEGVLYFNGASIYIDSGDTTFADLNSINVTGKTHLYSCYGGLGEEGDNVAWALAEITNSSVIANRGKVSYTEVFGVYIPRTNFQIDGQFNITAIWGNYYYNNNGEAKYFPGSI
jgi:hypothetical protein